MLSLTRIFRWGGSVDAKMKMLMAAQKRLFDAGARNFLFINLPPVERSPGLLPGK
jgi:hypothetical protein